jgi:hypothetical protein
MGRPACSSCCKVIEILPTRSGCRDQYYKVYYNLGGGGWKTSDEYDDHLQNNKLKLGDKIGAAWRSTRNQSPATATVTIIDIAELAIGDKVTLRATAAPATDIDFSVALAGPNTWAIALTNANTAINLAAAIDDHPDFSASAVGEVVTITQETKGLAGNTPVTLTDAGIAGMTSTDFVGGSDSKPHRFPFDWNGRRWDGSMGYNAVFPYTITNIVATGPNGEPTKIELTPLPWGGYPAVGSPFVIDVTETSTYKLRKEDGIVVWNKKGFKGLTAIKYVLTKSDYGEYLLGLTDDWPAVSCWTFGQSFYNPNDTGAEIMDNFKSGDQDVGWHLPARWTATIGDANGQNIVVTKQISGNISRASLERKPRIENVWPLSSVRHIHPDHIPPTVLINVDCRDNLGVDQFGRIDCLPSEKDAFGQCPTVTPVLTWKDWLINNGYLEFNTFGGLKESSKPSNFSVQVTDYFVEHTTKITHNGKIISDTVTETLYKTELRLFNFGVDTYAGTCTSFVMGMKISGQGGAVSTTTAFSAGLWGTNMDEYTSLSYCLTYPFFSHEHGTYYFRNGVDVDFTPPPDGTIEDTDGIEFYHADKKLFNEISVESTEFRVFNPYSNAGPEGVGRVVTGSELEDYTTIDPRFNAQGAYPYHGGTQAAEHGDSLNTWQTWYVTPPSAIYTDNKLSLSGEEPQSIVAENQSLDKIVELPVGWPRVDGKLGQSVETFEKYMLSNPRKREEGGPYIDIIFVSFRTKRGADESGIDIEEGMEVYHPVGDDDKYTIKQILEQGPNLKPTKVRISSGRIMNDKVVDVSEIELLEDVLQYTMCERTYKLQLVYLKALSTKEGKDYYNPFKYRVTRIDLINPDIDIDRVGSEISGSPQMVDIEVGVKVLYPIGQFDANGDAIVPDEYTIDEIVEPAPDSENAGDEPTKVRLSNPLAGADGDVVDVSEIELINPNENPTYIKMTNNWTLDVWDDRADWLERVYGFDVFGESYYLSLTEGSPANLEPVKSLPRGVRNTLVTSEFAFEEYSKTTEELDAERTGRPGEKGVENDNIFASRDKMFPKQAHWVIGTYNMGREALAFQHKEDGTAMRHYGADRDPNERFPNGQGGNPWNSYYLGPRWENRQLPQSGYFFGGGFKLKFYLEDIDEWKKKQL